MTASRRALFAGLAFVALATAAAPRATTPVPAPTTPIAKPVAPAAPVAMPAETLQVDSCTLVVGHRVFTEFRDRITVPLHDEVLIGDSDWSAEVVEFQPDFTMDLSTRTVTSRSLAPRNPAVRVIVSKAGTPTDTSWAFLKMPPHFARRSMLAFQLTRVSFKNHAPVEADSALLARPVSPTPHVGAPH